MLKNNASDTLTVTLRYLNSKQLYFPLPGQIPDDRLPPDFVELLAQITEKVEEMQANEIIRNKEW